MKRFWQVSTTLMLTALLANQAVAEGYGPRSWKSHLPGAAPTPAIKPEYEAPTTELPASIDEWVDSKAVTPASATEVDSSTEQTSSRKTAQAKAAKTEATAVSNSTVDSSKKEKFASYYDQNEQPPPAPGLLQNGSSPSDRVTPPPFVDEPGPAYSGAMGGGGGNCNCDSCNDTGYGDACPCMPTRNFARIEYLMWWGRGRSTPPLVTSAFAGTPVADAGVLGQPNTTVLYGGNDIGTDWRSGARLTVGRVLDKEGEWMAVGRFYGLGDSSDSFHAESAAGDPILARPFFNAVLLQNDALLVAYPGFVENGVIDVRSRSTMLGVDALVRHMVLGEEDLTVDLVGGYQFSRLDDSLDIRNSETVVLDPNGIIAPGTAVSIRDSFKTRNEFHGGVIGLATDVYRGNFRLEMLGKVGFGNQHQTATINGNTTFTPLVGPATNDPQGLLARATNSGVFSRDVFTIIPEANFTLGYQHKNWNFSLGYSFMYWKDVAWAGDQIDPRVNQSNPLVGAPLPAFQFRNTDHWLQGLSFGAEYQF
ncbi:BBP7 family outer membrane beta-barrel protein [Anatilimnocola floriformis]|uniref:BBP7 family outer membrane beta-barrel protein n=1 Tax=Anatilimnocola floriformis TaxID=2948575 RepID=UPI0020C2B052|nr:BBP7 family outer membrane beta-barrel protein [Anatilimnocola floriformis]